MAEGQKPAAPPEEATPITMGDVREMFTDVIEEREQATQTNVMATHNAIKADLEEKHRSEYRTAKKWVLGVLAGIIGSMVLSGIGFWVRTHDAIRAVEDMPTQMGIVELIETRAPWVRDKPVVEGKIDNLAEDIGEVAEEVKSIDHSVDAMRVEQSIQFRELLSEVRKNGNGGN